MCNHERQEEMNGIVFCVSCGEQTEVFFGFFRNVKPMSKLKKKGKTTKKLFYKWV